MPRSAKEGDGNLAQAKLTEIYRAKDVRLIFSRFAIQIRHPSQNKYSFCIYLEPRNAGKALNR